MKTETQESGQTERQQTTGKPPGAKSAVGEEPGAGWPAPGWEAGPAGV